MLIWKHPCQQPTSSKHLIVNHLALPTLITLFLFSFFSERWRPLNAPGVTKNVIIATNANGSLCHYHTTSGKLLNKIHDELNQLFTADYKPDGTEFITAGADAIIRVYDEQTRQLKMSLEGGGTGEPGHSNRVFCAKFCQDDERLIVSGGWDKNIKVWDTRNPSPVRSIVGPFVCGDSIDIFDGYILSGQYESDKQLQLWDFGNGEWVEDINFDDNLPSAKPCHVYACQFQKTTGDLIIAGGAGSNEIKVFNGDDLFKPCA